MNEPTTDQEGQALEDLIAAKGVKGLSAQELLRAFRFLINQGILRWSPGYGPKR